MTTSARRHRKPVLSVVILRSNATKNPLRRWEMRISPRAALGRNDGWRSGGCGVRRWGSPHQSADWFAMTTGSGSPRAYSARNDRRMKDRAVRRWGSFDSLLLEQVCLPPASMDIKRFAALCNTRKVTWGVDCGTSALCSESILHRNIVDISTPTCYNQSETSERSSEDREPSTVLLYRLVIFMILTGLLIIA